MDAKEAKLTPRTYAATFNFADVHPSTNINQDVVRADFASKLERENADLLAALQDAVELIKNWHNMGGADDVWPIYYENAPEMQPIRSALTRATEG